MLLHFILIASLDTDPHGVNSYGLDIWISRTKVILRFEVYQATHSSQEVSQDIICQRLIAWKALDQQYFEERILQKQSFTSNDLNKLDFFRARPNC